MLSFKLMWSRVLSFAFLKHSVEVVKRSLTTWEFQTSVGVMSSASMFQVTSDRVWSRSTVVNNWLAIEGAVGAGKSTLLDLLEKILRTRGFQKIILLKEPLEKWSVHFSLLEDDAPEAAIIMQLYVLAWGGSGFKNGAVEPRYFVYH